MKKIFSFFLLLFTLGLFAQEGVIQGNIKRRYDFESPARFINLLKLPDIQAVSRFPNTDCTGAIAFDYSSKILKIYSGSEWYSPVTVSAIGTNTTDGINISISGTVNTISASQGSSTQRGTIKLYSTTGTNVDGAVTQSLFTTTTSGKVNNTGNETIAGIKTFSLAPLVPTGTLGSGGSPAASQQYVENGMNALNLNVAMAKLDATPSSYVTGTTSSVIVKTYTIPANTLQNGAMIINAQFDRTTTATDDAFRVYMNTTNTLTGAQLISLSNTSVSSSSKNFLYQRPCYINLASSSSATLYTFSNSSPAFFPTATTQDPTVLTFDPSVTQYIMEVITPGSTSENCRVTSTDITIKRSN